MERRGFFARAAATVAAILFSWRKSEAVEASDVVIPRPTPKPSLELINLSLDLNLDHVSLFGRKVQVSEQFHEEFCAEDPAYAFRDRRSYRAYGFDVEVVRGQSSRMILRLPQRAPSFQITPWVGDSKTA